VSWRTRFMLRLDTDWSASPSRARRSFSALGPVWGALWLMIRALGRRAERPLGTLPTGPGPLRTGAGGPADAYFAQNCIHILLNRIAYTGRIGQP